MNLAPRQQQALTYTAKGFKQAEIAELMTCGTQNIKNLVRECVYKLHASNATEAVAIAVKRGLIQFCLLATVMAGSSLDDNQNIMRCRTRTTTRITRTRKEDA